MRAISSFILEVGISARSCIALFALRMRVSMSATGSVSTVVPSLPRALRHPRDHALMRQVAQADPAEAELAEDGARPAAPVAAAVVPHREPLGPGLLDDQRLLGHALLLPPVAGERKPEAAQERVRRLVGPGGGRDRDVEAADLLDVVVVDLGEDDLLAD